MITIRWWIPISPMTDFDDAYLSMRRWRLVLGDLLTPEVFNRAPALKHDMCRCYLCDIQRRESPPLPALQEFNKSLYLSARGGKSLVNYIEDVRRKIAAAFALPAHLVTNGRRTRCTEPCAAPFCDCPMRGWSASSPHPWPARPNETRATEDTSQGPRGPA